MNRDEGEYMKEDTVHHVWSCEKTSNSNNAFGIDLI